ncbi:hypothetical protein D3Z58_12340 [Clostridiaceae bacterium]|nr:hypothetical protein [Clostridiaceae bacterium]
MGMKNDISFILCHVMNVYEQQSSYNPNMPVRQLMYAAKLYDKYIQQKKLNIYGRKVVRLPIPKLMVFYNGTEDEDEQILRLSDAFIQEGNPAEAEVKDLCITEYNEAETMQMIREEGREEGRLKQAKKTAANMRKRGTSFEDIAEILELPVDMIRSWQGICPLSPEQGNQ